MSTEEDKFKNSRRRLKDENAVKRQTKIAKAAGSDVSQPHKFAKTHAMTCGNSNCVMCMNPRKSFNELTQQEKRLFQDLEKVTDKRSNGLKKMTTSGWRKRQIAESKENLMTRSLIEDEISILEAMLYNSSGNINEEMGIDLKASLELAKARLKAFNS